MVANNQNDLPFIAQIDKLGIDYIKKEQKYLMFSGLYPIIVAFIQIYNIILLLSRWDLKPPSMPNRQPPLIDLLTPYIIMLILSVFACIFFIFLIMWRRKINKFSHINQISNSEGDGDANSSSLIRIFYDIINFMNNAKIIFIFMNIIFIFYLQWLIRFILVGLHVLMPMERPPTIFIQIVNTFAQIGLIPYLLYEWKHFLKWNKKLQKISSFERKIFNEIQP